MDDRTTDLALRFAAGALTALGVVAVLLGYLGVRDEADVVLQLPYLMSGGLAGLALIGLGALALIQYQMRQQSQRMAQVADDLDDWKEQALRELRTFLESAVVEVELDVPDPVARPRTARTRNPTDTNARRAKLSA